MSASQASHDMDMTTGPLGRKVFLYTMPLAATGILQQLFNAADVAVVGQFVGKEAMAAVGANSSLVGLIIGVFAGISLGSNVMIANAIGRHDQEAVSRIVHTSIVFAVLAGLSMTLIGELLAVPILQVMGVPEEVFAMAVSYLRIYLLGMPVILLYNFEAAVFRSSGNTRTPLIMLTASGLINVLLNLFFVAVLHMTASGVALATVLSNAVSAVLLMLALLRTDSITRVDPKHLRIDRRALVSILRIGIPAGIQTGVFSFANIIIQAAINSLGATVMAASSAALNLEILANYMLVSFGQTCSTFVGQNYGAGKPDRCRKAMVVCLIETTCCTLSAIVLILFFGRSLLGLFNSDPEVIRIGYLRLQLIFLSYCFSMYSEVVSGYMRGFGIAVLPAMISVIGICGVRLIWIFTVFPAHPTFQTIMTAYPLSLGITTVSMIIAALIRRPSKQAAA